MNITSDLTFDRWLNEFLGILLYPVQDSFVSRLALVALLVFMVLLVGAFSQNLGTDLDDPFDFDNLD